jgi:hypothetical protein
MPPPEKPKLSVEERRRRQADRLASIRLRMAIGRELENRGITTPSAIGAALGLPATEAAKLLTRHQWREGDVALLEAAAAGSGCGCRTRGAPQPTPRNRPGKPELPRGRGFRCASIPGALNPRWRYRYRHPHRSVEPGKPQPVIWLHAALPPNWVETEP